MLAFFPNFPMTPVDFDNSPAADAQAAPQQSQEQNVPETPSVSDDLAEKYAAAQREAAEWRGRAEARAEEVNRLKKAVFNEEEPQAEEPTPATTNDIKSVKDEIRWELKHEKEIELANQNGKFDEYRKDHDAPTALKLALFDEGITNSANHADSMRQAAAAAPSAGVDRTNHDSPIEGFPKAEYEKLKAQGLSDQRIKEIVRNAFTRAAKRR